MPFCYIYTSLMFLYFEVSFNFKVTLCVAKITQNIVHSSFINITQEAREDADHREQSIKHNLQDLPVFIRAFFRTPSRKSELFAIAAT